VLATDLLAMVTPETAGDPRRPRQWVRRSLCPLRQRLAEAGHAVSAPTVSRLLHQHDEALRVKAKEQEVGAQHPDRDRQFQDREAQQQAFAAAGQPIISVDTKKKELIGDFKHAGQGGAAID
jgi:Rhodopirellula transposase DDE domain